jgi:hypothetical protein
MSKAVEAPVATQQEAAKPQAGRPRPGEWAITAFMLVFFAGGYLLAEQWPFRAALFPQIVSAIGFMLTVVRLVMLVVQTVRGRKAASDVAVVPSTMAALVPEQPADTTAEAKQVRTAAVEGEERGVTEPAQGTAVTIVDDEAEEDESMEYVFASAGGRAWGAAIAWIVAFFVAFFVLGVFIAVPLFALIYLKFSGRASWLAAAIYAAVTGFLIYALFRWVVYIDLPTGYIPFLQL